MDTPETQNDAAAQQVAYLNGKKYSVYTKDDITYYYDGEKMYVRQNDGLYNGDITVVADLTQNMDGKFKGYLGAQALAGAVTAPAASSPSAAR
jgi:hypothetical protein